MTYQSTILADSPYVYWRGQISAGTIADATGGGRAMGVIGGSMANAASILPGVAGDSVLFPGTAGNYLFSNFGTFMDFNTFNPTQPRSVEFWLLADADANPLAGLFHWMLVSTALMSAQRLRHFMINIGDNSDTVPYGYDYLSGGLRHVALIIDANAGLAPVRSYVNGKLVDSFLDTHTRAGLGIDARIAFGVAANVGVIQASTEFKGRMQEIAMYNSALTVTQVNRHYYAGIDDGVAPRLASARALSSGTIRATYSKPVFGADLAGSYSLSTGSVSSVALVADTSYTTYDLTVSGLTAGSSYTLTASGAVTDAHGAALTNSSAVFLASTISDISQDNPASVRINTSISVGSVVGAILPPEIIIPEITTQYSMRAYHTVLIKYIYWDSTNAPDFTGQYSGYSALDLTDIILLKTTPQV